MSLAMTVPGPCFFTTMRLGPSPCILMAMSLMLSTMSVTSSRTPAIEENSCSTPSMCTDCTAAPCSEDNKMRRSAREGGGGDAARGQGARRRSTARPGPRHFHLQRPHPVLLRLLGGILGGDLRRVGGRLARALEAHGAGRRPGNGIALDVGDRD